MPPNGIVTLVFLFSLVAIRYNKGGLAETKEEK